MKAIIRTAVLALGLLTPLISSYPQCQIINRLSPDGSMQYYMEPVNFYTTNTKSLKGCIVTDKENYFLELLPVPFPEKPEGRKLKSPLSVMLSDGNSYTLEHFDTRYVEKDTVMELIYLIQKEDIGKFLNSEVNEVSIDMMGTEGLRTYVFKLHKSSLKEQLACFLKVDEGKKQK